MQGHGARVHPRHLEGCLSVTLPLFSKLNFECHLTFFQTDDYQLRESSVDPESSYVDPDCGPSSTNRTSSSSSYVAATVVGVGLGGKTCIAVNEKSSVETTSVKIWTTSEDVSTSNFVQTTAIVHPTPKWKLDLVKSTHGIWFCHPGAMNPISWCWNNHDENNITLFSIWKYFFSFFFISFQQMKSLWTTFLLFLKVQCQLRHKKYLKNI